MRARTSEVVLGDGVHLPVALAEPPAGAPVRRTTAVLAPGAGSSMRHPSLVAIQTALALAGVATATFDFPYRARGARAPDRLPTLVAAYRAVLDALRRDPAVAAGRIVIGGRSLGGRVASHVAAEGASVDGLVFLAFPLHPPGKPGIERAAHLGRIGAPMLFVQGTRDAFARADLLARVLRGLPRATLHAIPDADHGFRVPKRTGRTEADVRDEAVRAILGWLDAVPALR
jgi:uncharacterized protein